MTAALAAVITLTTAPSKPASPPPEFGNDATDATMPDKPSDGGAASPPPRAQAPSPPQRILVPSVGLDARIRPVGVTERGDLAVPSDSGVAGWYRFGPAPGSARGSSVLVGHVDSDTGDLGEFAALYDVEPGDRVDVRRAGAAPARYRITARAVVASDAIPASAFSRSGMPVLTLVTCAPPFLPEHGGYQANLLVTAELITG